MTQNSETEILKVSGTPTSDATMNVHANALDDLDDGLSDFEDAPRIEDTDSEEHESNLLKMLESHTQAYLKQNGTRF